MNKSQIRLKSVLLIVVLFSCLSCIPVFAQEKSVVFVDDQVEITADLTNSQDRSQEFAYLVQIKSDDDVTVSLAWITGSLSPNQHLSPALLWIPEKAGTYTAEIYVWESISNPVALSSPLFLEIEVQEEITA